MSERKEGWYWVKPDGDQWEAACWDGGAWLVADVDGSWPESEIEVVGPRIPLPNEAPSTGTRYRNDAGEVVVVVVPAEADKDMVEHGMIDSGYCAGIGSAEEAWRFFLAALPEPD